MLSPLRLPAKGVAFNADATAASDHARDGTASIPVNRTTHFKISSDCSSKLILATTNSITIFFLRQYAHGQSLSTVH